MRERVTNKCHLDLTLNLFFVIYLSRILSVDVSIFYKFSQTVNLTMIKSKIA